MKRSRATPFLLGTCLLLSLPTAFAQAESRPWYLGVSLSLTQVNNVYRVSELPNEGQEVSNDDRVLGTSLYGGLRSHFGRQLLRFDGSLSNSNYQRNPGLRYQGYTGNAGLDWQLGNDLSGSVDVNGQRALAPFNPGNLPATVSKNIETNRGLALTARYGLFGPWSIDAGLTRSERDYSLALYERWELEQTSRELGLRWSPSPALTTRLVARQGDGKYPRYAVLPAAQGGGYQEDRFRRKDLDLYLTWQPSSLHTLVARIGQGRTTYELVTANDSKGTNYRLDWTWLPSNKLRLQTVLARENGAENQQRGLGNTLAADALNSRRYDTLQMQMAYALATKLTLTASVAETRRTVDNRVDGNTGNDRTQTASLGLNWAYTRNGSVGCQLSGDRRRGTALFGQAYSSHSYGCTLRYGVNG